jgi:hypothetical protein
MKTLKQRTLLATATAALVLMPGAVLAQAEANAAPQSMAQATEAAASTCIPLQEVTTGQNEVRKRIENRSLLGNNWHTDFLVPSEPTFSYFVAFVTPENSAPYWMDLHLRMPHGGSEKVLSERADLAGGSTYSIPFQSDTGRQPAVINARLGGVNGNFYTISIAACE